MKLQVSVLHSQPLMLIALQSLLHKEHPHFELSRMYSTEKQLISDLSKDRRIDVLVVGGILISEMTEIFSQIKNKLHATHVIVLAANHDYELRQIVSQQGDICLSDFCTPEEVLHALYMVINANRRNPLLVSLSEREHEVALLAFQGLNTSAIADKLFISRRTVQNHKMHIYLKTGIHSMEELRQRCRDTTPQLS